MLLILYALIALTPPFIMGWRAKRKLTLYVLAPLTTVALIIIPTVYMLMFGMARGLPLDGLQLMGLFAFLYLPVGVVAGIGFALLGRYLSRR